MGETFSEYCRTRIKTCPSCLRTRNADERCRCDGMLKLKIPTDEQLIDEFNARLREISKESS